jgi:hypothetical protein
MRLLKTLFVAAALALAAPAWAHGGHGHDRHHRHNGWHGERHHGHARHHHHHRHYARSFEHRYYSNYYYPPQPVYAVPAPGVHIVVPNIYIPLR